MFIKRSFWGTHFRFSGNQPLKRVLKFSDSLDLSWLRLRTLLICWIPEDHQYSLMQAWRFHSTHYSTFKDPQSATGWFKLPSAHKIALISLSNSILITHYFTLSHNLFNEDSSALAESKSKKGRKKLKSYQKKRVFFLSRFLVFWFEDLDKVEVKHREGFSV